MHDRSGARLWLRMFAPFYALATGLMLWTVLTPPFRGDLTRLGRLSEAAFGPTLATPHVPPALLVPSALTDADVLVIGDSFSKPLLWQSMLVAQGMKIATTTWQDMGPVCADLASQLRAHGFRGTRLIIESVERGLEGHLDASQACNRSGPGGIPTVRTAWTFSSAGAFGLNTKETLFSGLLTTLHTLRAGSSTAPELTNPFDGAELVRIQTVADGCRMFSHRLCERGLFTVDDRRAAAFSAGSVGRMQRLAERHPELSITWLVIPNKTTIYLEPARARRIGSALVTEGLGPDLFSLLEARREQTRDLYSPNDTHTSTAGYLEIGQEVSRWMLGATHP